MFFWNRFNIFPALFRYLSQIQGYTIVRYAELFGFVDFSVDFSNSIVYTKVMKRLESFPITSQNYLVIF